MKENKKLIRYFYVVYTFPEGMGSFYSEVIGCIDIDYWKKNIKKEKSIDNITITNFIEISYDDWVYNIRETKTLK